MLTPKELLDNGFRQHPLPRGGREHADGFYQKRVRDGAGTKYFIDCYFYESVENGNNWEVDVYFGNGCNWYEDHTATFITIYGCTIAAWTLLDLYHWAEEVWERLSPRHYETEQGSERE